MAAGVGPCTGAIVQDFTGDDLEAVRKAQGVEWSRATSWDPHGLDGAGTSTRRRRPGGISRGIVDGRQVARSRRWRRATAEYLWDLTSPPWPGQPGAQGLAHKSEVDSYVHYRLIGLAGMPLGEMWFLEDLAADCAEDGVYEFLLTSAPLNLLGGVGSPPNALAIK